MNKSIELFGVMVAVATFSSSAFADYVATNATPATVSASVKLNVTKSGQALTKYDPPQDAQGRTYFRVVPTTVTYAWTGTGPEPPVDIYQRAVVDVDLRTSGSNPNVEHTAEVKSGVGINRSINSGNERITFVTGEAWLGKGPSPDHTATVYVGVQAKAFVSTAFAPPGSSGTSQSAIAFKMSEARFDYYKPPAGTAAAAPEPGVVGRGGP